MIDRETLARLVEFHGHMCPGLAMGIRASEVALERIGPHSADEEVVAIVETDMCGVDAVQFLTGCTFGKGNLVHHDFGKNAYTFLRRSDGRAVRVSMRPGGFGPPDPDRETRFAGHRERSQQILATPLEELYDVRDVDVDLPPLARVFASVECASCGEPTMETRVRRLAGRELCPPCFDAALAGDAPVAAPLRAPSGTEDAASA